MKWHIEDNRVGSAAEGAFLLTVEARAEGDGYLWMVGVDDTLEDPARSDMGIAKTLSGAIADAEDALTDIITELFDLLAEAA